ncbi:MAG: helix-turn-helix transcriptional regulator [Spirochaetaceae bacterium]|nr:helix-turn-helix transcriptional regulator [Spirochaetaceae bacterium]
MQKIFIINLKKLRKEKGISQMLLAEKCDTSANYIGQIEMGRRIPSFEKIEKIAAALNIHPSLLFVVENSGEIKEQKLKTKDYLERMPVHVKKELFTRLVALIKADIAESLDAKNY